MSASRAMLTTITPRTHALIQNQVLCMLLLLLISRTLEANFFLLLLTKTLTPLQSILLLPELILCVILILFLRMHLPNIDSRIDHTFLTSPKKPKKPQKEQAEEQAKKKQEHVQIPSHHSYSISTIPHIHKTLTLRDSRITSSDKHSNTILNSKALISITILTLFLLFGLNACLSLVFGEEKSQLSLPADLGIAYSLYGLTMVIVSSITEELLFRGALYLACKQHSLRYVICSTLIFSLLHHPLPSLIFSFFVGLCFSLIFLVHKNLLALIISHLCYNSLILIALYITTS